MPLKQQKNEKRLSLTEKNMIFGEIVRDEEKNNSFVTLDRLL